jgi:hypothetical protein
MIGVGITLTPSKGVRPPAGFVFVTNSQGGYVVNAAGQRIIAREPAQ